MKSHPVYLSDLHTEHQAWLSALSFYTEDLDVLEEQLSEAGIKNNSHEARSAVEKFQGQFVGIRNELSGLQEQVNKHEDSIVQFAQEHPVAIEHVHFADQDDLRGQMANFEGEMKAFRHEFQLFVAQYL